jgi:ribosomal protein L11 methyltransferase
MSGAKEAWIEVRVVAPEEWLELVAEAISPHPDAQVAFGRPSLGSPAPPAGMEVVRAAFRAEDDRKELRDAIAARLAALATTADDPVLEGLVATYHELPPEDWSTSWRKSFRPLRVGRFALLLLGEDRPLRPGDVPIRIEPGIPFGTGRHPTTRQCLIALSERDVEGARVLDAGTGSGLLAVAAAVRGAREGIGFDIDPSCERPARELAARHGAEARCTFLTGGFELLDAPLPARAPFDVVVANVYADLLQRHAADFARCLAPGGWFAFAGCSAPGAPSVRAALAAAGLVVERELVRGRWHGFHGRARS